MFKKIFPLINKFFQDWKWPGVIILGTVSLFFLIRLVNLTKLPIFADEAVYIRWAQVMKAETSLRFIPLSVGAPPFFMWMLIPLMKPFLDPLWAGRILSVVSGFFSLIGIFLASYLLFKNKFISLLSILLYSILPFFVFSERLALIDSMLSMFGVILAALGILLSQYPRLDLAMIMGGIFAAALLTKSPAVFFISSVSALIFLPRWNFKDREQTILKFLKLFGLLLIIFSIGFGFYRFILKLGPNFELIKFRNSLGTYGFKEIIAHPLDPLIPHLKDLFDWLPNLLTLPVLLLVILGIFLSFKEYKKQTIYLFFWSIIPLFIESVVSKANTPRYVLFMIWPFIVFASLALEKILIFCKKKIPAKIPYWFSVLCIVFIFTFSALRYDFLLMTDHEKAPLPRNLRSGHLEEWTAGQGIKEIADFLKDLPKNQKILVGTEGTFGTLPDGLQIYLEKIPNITVLGVGQPIGEIPKSLTDGLIDSRVFLVVNDSRFSVNDWSSLNLIKKFPKAQKPEGKSENLLFFELIKK